MRYGKATSSVWTTSVFILTEAEIFRARVVTATPENYVFEVTGDTGKVEAFLDVVRPYGIDEMVRTGKVALHRNLVAKAYENSESASSAAR